MKTLHLTNAWHSTSGGISTFYRALMDAANSIGREVVLVVPGPDNAMDRYGQHCRIYSIKAPSSPFDRNYRFITPRTFLDGRSQFTAILRNEAPDVVEVCDKYTLNYVAGLWRIGLLPGVKHRPTVIGLSCERFDENIAAYLWQGTVTRALCRLYMKWLYFPFADHHIAVTEHTAGELRPSSHGHKVTRAVWVAPMGVDTATFTPARRSGEVRAWLHETAGAGRDAVLALYVGRLAPEKNLPLLVETMRELQGDRRNFHLLIVGDGPMRAQLESAATAQCPNRVHFLGHLGDRKRLADVYANCDLFLHPNPREPFGIAPLEAMAAGVPLIAPETGGVRTYANNANAWLAPDDPVAYARACVDVSNGNAALKIAAALETVQNYSWPEICRRYFRLYDEIHQYRLSGRSTTQPAAFHSSPTTAETKKDLNVYNNFMRS